MATRREWTGLDHDALRRLLADPQTVLVDVGADADYATGHLPGARSVPADDPAFDGRMRRLVRDRETPVVLYDSGEGESAASDAAQRLVDMGYARVHVYREGRRAWVEAGDELSGRDAEAGTLADLEQELDWQEQDKPGLQAAHRRE